MGKRKVATAAVGCAVENQEDILPGGLSRERRGKPGSMRRGQFIRPKRASSANMIRKRRPRLAAARLAFLTAFGKPFF